MIRRPSQDSLPPRPFREIKAQIEGELGRPLHAVFEHVVAGALR